MPSDPPPNEIDPRAAPYLRTAGEGLLLTLLVAAPWPFASTDPPAEFVLAAGVALLAALWAAHAAIVRRLTVHRDAVTLALGGLVFWTAFQLVPLPEAAVGVIAPRRVEWHRTLLPAQEEVLPGEAAPVVRPAFLPLTVDPSATRTFAYRLLALFVVYLVARNWLATRESFPRLAWAMTANGVALAFFALGQSAWSPKGEMFWSVRVPDGAGPFGPFICRNHYPDYVGLCMGLCLGLLLPRHRTPTEGPGPKLVTGRTLALTAALALMAVSVPFSLSRGGTIAVVLAGVGAWALAWSVKRRGGAAGWAILAAAAGAVAAAAWLGVNAVEDRLTTLTTEESTTSRIPLWTDSLRLVPGVWGGGTGGGTYVWAEPTVRRDGSPAQIYYENAHNEYLEALVEGGVVRAALTIGLVGGGFVALVRGYRRRHDRSAGPWLIGGAFGLAVVALHAVTDFGIHVPPVALLTVVVAGFATAAAQNDGFVPPRARRRDPRRSPAATVAAKSPEGPPAPAATRSRGTTFRGVPALLVGVLVAALAMAAAGDARSRSESYRRLLSADEAAAEGRTADRVRDLDARAAARPSDPDALFAAAQAHLDQAVAVTWAPGAGVGGGAAGFLVPPDRLTPLAVERHLVPALRLLRDARRSNPLAPKPHTRFGLYADYFASAEPAAVHFARAKTLLPSDPEVWYASGRDALRRGDTAAAWADWKRSLEIAPQTLPTVLAAARRVLTVDEVRTLLLPDDPVTVLAAADWLLPDRNDRAAERRPFLDRVLELTRSSDRPSPDRLMASAVALDELGRFDEANDAWVRALQLAPDRPEVRDRYARWLEREERYDEAVPHLEWLRRTNLADQGVKDRLDAARHALRLNREIEGEASGR